MNDSSMTEKPEGRRVRRHRPTMTDVAQRAGVSQATVSLVLNNVGGSRVNEETAQKVRSAARLVGYSLSRRNHIGAGTTQFIGYIIEDTLTNPLVNIAIDAARQAAWDNDCVLLVLPTKGDSSLHSAALDVLMQQRLAGVIMSSFFTSTVSIPEKLRSQRAVLLNCYSESDSVPTILPAHRQGAQSGVTHLIERGHTRIGMIIGPAWMDAYRDRLDGYRRALDAAGLPFDPALIVEGDTTPHDGQTGTDALLALDNPPSAIFCCTDQVAVGCYHTLRTRGLRIPQDVAVLGFDDDPVMRFLDPALTTIAVPHAAMGARAVAHLLALRDGNQDDVITGRTYVPAPLVVRAST